MENATAFPGSLWPCSTSSVTGLRRLGNNLPTAMRLIFNWPRQPDMSERLVIIG